MNSMQLFLAPLVREGMLLDLAISNVCRHCFKQCAPRLKSTKTFLDKVMFCRV